MQLRQQEAMREELEAMRRELCGEQEAMRTAMQEELYGKLDALLARMAVAGEQDRH